MMMQPPKYIHVTGTPEEQAQIDRVIQARHEFNLSYCRSKGWPLDLGELSIAQILEIRAQDGWINAGKENGDA